MREFTKAYTDTLLWSSTDDDGEPLDAIYTADDLAPEALARIVSDCTDFLSDPHTLELCEKHGMTRSGHDFWLTRNRHGVGFWDRGHGAEGDYLTDRAHVYGEQDPYVGDDGQIYL